MKTNLKDKSLIYIIGAVAVGALGYFGYKKYMENKLPTPTPEPTPEPTPTPTPKKKGTTPTNASAAKINELQKLMIRRFVQLNRASEYTESDAKGGWGNKSRTALQYLQRQNYASKGDPNASNIDFWIQAINKDVETAAKESAQMKTKQTSVDQLKKLSKDIVAYLKTGGRAKVINDFTSVKHQFDAVKKTYIPLSETKTYRKGLSFGDGDLVDRGNGQIMIKSGVYRYPTSPENLLTFAN